MTPISSKNIGGLEGGKGQKIQDKLVTSVMDVPPRSQIETFGLIDNWNSGLLFDPIFEGFVLALIHSSFV